MKEMNMTPLLLDEAGLQAFIDSSPIAAVYFSAPDCAVCTVLQPKLLAMLAAEYPKVACAEVDCARSRVLAAAYSVFTIPTLIVFTQSRESFRMARSFGLVALAAQLERPYSVLYG